MPRLRSDDGVLLKCVISAQDDPSIDPVETDTAELTVTEPAQPPVWIANIPDLEGNEDDLPFSINLDSYCDFADSYVNMGAGDIVGSTLTLPVSPPDTYTIQAIAVNDTASVASNEATWIVNETVGTRYVLGSPGNNEVAMAQGIPDWPEPSNFEIDFWMKITGEWGGTELGAHGFSSSQSNRAFNFEIPHQSTRIRYNLQAGGAELIQYNTEDLPTDQWLNVKIGWADGDAYIDVLGINRWSWNHPAFNPTYTGQTRYRIMQGTSGEANIGRVLIRDYSFTYLDPPQTMHWVLNDNALIAVNSGDNGSTWDIENCIPGMWFSDDDDTSR